MPTLLLHDPSRTPPSPAFGLVVWSMNTVCPYRCSYCTQSFRDDHARWRADTPRFLHAISALPGSWEVKLTGGEPTAHPGIRDIVEQLADQGRSVSIVSGFMDRPQNLARLAQAARDKAGLFSASMHLEYVQPAAFLDKLRAFAEVWGGEVEATVVATRPDVIRLPPMVEEFARAGVALRVRMHRVGGGTTPYDGPERAVLLQHGGHLGTGEIEHNYRGRSCWAGARFFTLDNHGNAWRCSSARRERTEPLGNVLDQSFSLHTEPAPCPYARCRSTEVRARGMLQAD